jgi:hypothetical protein
MAPPLAGMRLVAVQVIGIGLDNTAVLEKEQAGFIGGHAGRQGFSLVEGGAQTGEDFGWLSRL